MATRIRPGKGPWTHRFLVHVFTVASGVLVYWLLGFVVDDIGSVRGPDYNDVEERMLDRELVEKSRVLQEKLRATERQMTEERAEQQILRDSTDSSQRTMTQLLEFQRLNLQKGGTPSADEQKALADSEALFLGNEKEYQRLNQEIARLNEQLRQVQNEERELNRELESKREPIRKEFDALVHRHEMKMAALKLGALTPLLLVAVFLFVKKRAGIYAPLVYAFGAAVLLKVAEVMHEYFPSRYFKYILIGACLLVVLRALVYLLRMIAFPKTDWLLKQYREAYEAFLCPVCDYPIRRGPLKFLVWTRRSIRKLQIPALAQGESDQPYTCPTCGTRLFEECTTCHAVRHSLLPTCEKCGAEKPIGHAEA